MSTFLDRRRFLREACAAGALLQSRTGSPLLSPAVAASPGTAPPRGDPYRPAGRRIVFTNWHWIRPATNATARWFDRDGKKCEIGEKREPGDCQLEMRNVPFGVRLRVLPAERMGPLEIAPGPDGGGVTINTIIREDGSFRGWTIPWVNVGGPPGSTFCYYWESGDGLHWKRPNLGLYEHRGNRANNILNLFDLEGGSIFVDPSADAAARYKLVAGAFYGPEMVREFQRGHPDFLLGPAVTENRWLAIKGGTSADGLHWNILPRPLSIETTDTEIVGCYDRDLAKYVIYTRKMDLGVQGPHAADVKAGRGGGRRVIGRTESADFSSFPVSQTILEPGPDMPPSDVFYSNCRTTIPGAPDHHLMFPAIWHMDDDSTSIAAASSADGLNWHLMPGSPVLNAGPVGAFDGGCIFSHPNLIELADGSFALPYTGYNVTHKYPRGLWRFAPGYAVWPKGRLAALEATERGECATMRILPPGSRLRMNVLTARAGSVRVEVVGPDGKTLPRRSFADCQPIYGDQAKAMVHWGPEDNLGHPEGAPIHLRFQLYKASIFGLEFV